MPTVLLSPIGGAGAQFFDNNGTPLSGGRLYSYAAGTTTPQATYTTLDGVVAHTNPIVLDAAGRVPSGGEVWLIQGVYTKLVLTTSAGTTLATWDNLAGINNANAVDNELRATLASTAPGKGLSAIAFDPAVTPTSGSAALPVAATHHSSRSFLEMIPVNEWDAILTRTSTYDCSLAFSQADALGGEWTLPEGQFLFNSGIEIINSRWVGAGQSNGGAYGTVFLFNESTLGAGVPAVKTRQASSPRPSIGMEFLTIKSNGWSGTHHGFDIEAKTYLRDVYALGFSGRGFYAHHNLAGTLGPYESVWQGISAMYSGDHGIVIGDGANNMTLINPQAKWNGAPAYLTAPAVAGSFDGLWSGSIATDGYPVYTPEGLSIIGGDCSYNARYGWNIDGAARSTLQINYSELNKGTYNVRVGQNRTNTSIHINGTLGGATSVLINNYGPTDDTNALFLGGKVLGNGNISWLNANKQLVVSTDPTLVKACGFVPNSTTGDASLGGYGGATLTIGSGASIALPLLANVQFSGVNTTGAGSASLGANSPASVLTAPYKWVRVLASDGTTCFMPIWK